MGLKHKCQKCGEPLGFEGLCWKCRAKQHRKEVDLWTEKELQEKTQQVIQKLREENPDKKFYQTDECDLFYDLMTRNIDTREIATAACENGIYYPAALYYRADKEVCGKLIEKILVTESSDEASQLMCCLAMIGGKKAQDVLYELKIHPRPWRKNLYVDSDIYAEEGGWTFDENNNFIKLTYDTCLSFELSDKKDEHTFIARKRGEKCPHCGCELLDMLVIDGSDEKFSFLGIDGIITAACCPNCVTLSEGISCKFDLNGKSELLPYEGEQENYYSEEYFEKMIQNTYAVSPQKKSLFHSAFSDDVHTIGGFASWVQDAEYKKCPTCGKKMKYLAQIHWGMLDDGEGTLYFEICPECRIITMFHQQT